jgi:hypothetical protein
LRDLASKETDKVTEGGANVTNKTRGLPCHFAKFRPWQEGREGAGRAKDVQVLLLGL